MRLTEDGSLEPDDHGSENKAADAPSAIANQTPKAAKVAVQEGSRSFLSNTHTVAL